MTDTIFGKKEWFRPTDDFCRELARKARCPQVGDKAMVGDVVALGMEPGDPLGRIVGFLNDGGLGNVAVQHFVNGDGIEPTGEIHRGALGVAYCGWICAPDFGAPEHAPDRPPRVCKWCGTVFTPTNKRGPEPDYCKNSHRRRANEAKERNELEVKAKAWDLLYDLIAVRRDHFSRVENKKLYEETTMHLEEMDQVLRTTKRPE